MKNIHEAIRRELELQQMLNGAIREKELGLLQLKGILLHALNLVSGLLDEPRDAHSPAAQVEPGEPEGTVEPQTGPEKDSQETVRSDEKENHQSHDLPRDLP